MHLKKLLQNPLNHHWNTERRDNSKYLDLKGKPWNFMDTAHSVKIDDLLDSHPNSQFNCLEQTFCQHAFQAEITENGEQTEEFLYKKHQNVTELNF